MPNSVVKAARFSGVRLKAETISSVSDVLAARVSTRAQRPKPTMPSFTGCAISSSPLLAPVLNHMNGRWASAPASACDQRCQWRERDGSTAAIDIQQSVSEPERGLVKQWRSPGGVNADIPVATAALFRGAQPAGDDGRMMRLWLHSQLSIGKEVRRVDRI